MDNPAGVAVNVVAPVAPVNVGVTEVVALVHNGVV